MASCPFLCDFLGFYQWMFCEIFLSAVYGSLNGAEGNGAGAELPNRTKQISPEIVLVRPFLILSVFENISNQLPEIFI